MYDKFEVVVEARSFLNPHIFLIVALSTKGNRPDQMGQIRGLKFTPEKA